VWHRYFGKRICNSVVGIVGVGRIGKLVVSHLLNLGCKKILINDVNGAVLKKFRSESVEWCEKSEIYKYADVISLHVPLTATTLNMIAEKELENMKPGACLVNTSR
jgi:D-3-phosphoglycerate dehydrogenase